MRLPGHFSSFRALLFTYSLIATLAFVMPSHRPFADYESKWQKSWEERGIYHAKQFAGEKFYGLIEFPYPSGAGLHVGHPRSYIAIDAVTRKRRMEGKNVLYPIGWDAFGLPTENFAIRNRMKPQDATAQNIATFTRQLASIGCGFDWSREINTTDPPYYKWTQWMFLQFFKSTFDEREGRARYAEDREAPVSVNDEQGMTHHAPLRMAYKAKTTINWCPSCKIGLANEEAQGGTCERCGAPVEKREKEQWMIRITAYADRLLEDLSKVDYLEKIKKQQEDWIGQSRGADVVFKMSTGDAVTVFTTRPDTLFGATYMAFAPEHELITAWMDRGLVSNPGEVKKYREQAAKKSDMERAADDKDKTGVRVEGVAAYNPASGEKIPVFVADYVLAGYGTGAVMAVPAHDERDFLFAKKHGLPVRYVVAPHVIDRKNPPVQDRPAVPRRIVHAIVHDPRTDQYLCLRWKEHPWITFVLGGVEEGEDLVEAARREVLEETGYADLTLKRVLGGPIRSEYYAAHKEENRVAEATAVLFELASMKRQEVDYEELAKHEPVWLDPEELNMEKMTCSELPFWLRRMHDPDADAYAGDGVNVNSDFLDGLSTSDAKDKIIAWLEEKGLGKAAVNYKLRDWVFSRQRYWGEPIPIVHCEKCGYVPVPEDQLPVLLPDVDSYETTDTGESPLAKIRDWVETTCPKCGGKAERETDTMPNWAGSSWYFLRYCDPKNDERFASEESLKYWMPVDLYNGGMEHTTLHLLYSRFWYKVLWDLGHIPIECGPEPYAKRRSHGLILAEGGEKMSKSKGNVVNPDDVIAQYGADVFRVYEMFMGPFDQPVPWDTNGIEGVKRFLDKVWRLFEERASGIGHRASDNLEMVYHQTIKKVSEDIETFSFNTAVSQLMILTNAFQEAGGVPKKMADGYLKLLAPFAPHIAEELWEKTGHEGSIHVSDWPAFDSAKAVAATFELVIQVNGRVRDRMRVPADISEEEAKAKALASENVQRHLQGREPKKIMYVKGRIVTIAV
jgi:leucyl-tRNA synthetase